MQQMATVQAPSKRYFMVRLQVGVSRESARNPPGKAYDGPKPYLSTILATIAPMAISAAPPAISVGGFMAIERLYQG